MSMNAIPEPVQPASSSCNQCIAETFHMFEWEKTCQAYLEPIMDAEKAAVGEGEILCNVEFKLAYGGKILLNTTHFHVRRGRIYGLLGHNGCGKSTLMRAISSGQLAGFPGAEELMKLRACFFVEKCPMAKAYFSIHDTEMKFTFPVPGPLEGVKSKTKAIIQAKNISFTTAASPTPQHAFHHIEQHLEMSPVEYIQWRFSGGLDKEQQAMEAAQMTDEEKAKLKQNFVVYLKELAAELDEAGNATASARSSSRRWSPSRPARSPADGHPERHLPHCVRQIKQLVGRRSRHGDYEYEVKWAKQDGTSMEDNKNLYLPKVVLESNGFFKLMKAIDDKIAAEAGNVKPLTTGCIQKHLDDFGLMEEFGTYGKMKNPPAARRRSTSPAPSGWRPSAPRAREQKMKKKAAPTQEEDKFDALGNKIETETKAADVDRDMIKLMTKKLKGLKERLKKGDEKEAAKAEKEAQKKLNKKEKAPADKKKASKKK
ncbi:ATPase [Aureococcus anophagefferens]|nr:ATPase [Aureococcus anophagefferens]